MTASKIQPGDDTHLTLLMAPHSLNFVTGPDRAALLAYGRDVFAAARDSKCLAQIEEPAVAAPAAGAVPAWDKTRDSLATLLLGLARRPFLDFDVACIALDAATEPGMPLAYMRGAPAAPALEAPAAPAVPAGFALVPIEPTQEMLNAGRWSGAGSVSIQEEWARKEMWSRMLATITPPPAAYTDDLVALVENLAQALSAAAPDNDLAGHALEYLKRNGLQGSPLWAAEAAPQAPAAPVVLPEPALWTLQSELDAKRTTTSGHLWFSNPVNCLWTGLYTAQQLHALLSAAPAAPVVDDEGCLSDELRDLITGMTVSVDVSTGEHDAGNRLFGEITEVMEYDQGSDKHGVVLLVQSPEPNFKAAPAAPAVDAPKELDPSLSREVYRACEDLPEGWSIRIDLENGYGGMKLIDPDGEEDELPVDGLLSDAMRASIAAAQAAAKGAAS
ncbi:hypothetical protein [Delftia lacustris]|uniref:hypothetical protein n=1 Tax=Delftia lacustris TaxID=558537 RepID=UPI001EF14F46|nr:hypothetical protein [Delftia lacustris]